MSKAVMQLETLTCPSCIKKIQGALEKTEGIAEVTVLFNSSKVKVEYDENQLAAENVKEVIEKLGYEVKTVKTA